MAPTATTTTSPSAAQAAISMIQSSLPDDKKLPVTLLSGFLGAGKTTLLTNLLRSKAHGLRIGIIVNDIGEVNIDGALLSQSQARVSSTSANSEKNKQLQKVVEMQNGCICCTLRPELVSEVAQMARDGKVDYLVVESSGVSEPMQVAETFAPEFTDMMKDAAEQMINDKATVEQMTPEERESQAGLASILAQGGLPAISKLDTCCTVVDAANIFNDFETADFLVDRHGKEEVPEEDDRNISDLMVDQLEFADVVVLNKVDLVSPEEVPRILSLIKTLNPSAHVIQAKHAQIDPKEVLNTNRFSYARAAMAAGWLQSLQEAPTPETEEYGVGTFVYKQRRPFHPRRLWETVRNVFVVIQEEFIDDGIDVDVEEIDGSDAGSDVEMSSVSGGKTDSGVDIDSTDSSGSDEDGGRKAQKSRSGKDFEKDGANAAEDDGAEESQPALNPKARLAAKKASKTWAPLLRSKGFFWLATRPLMFGEWSQAGVMLTLSGGGRWRCTMSKDEWSEDADVVQAIEADFQLPYGDRRQELVFIGTEMRKGGKERLIEALDKCLLNDEEMEEFKRIMEAPEPSKKQKKNKKKGSAAASKTSRTGLGMAVPSQKSLEAKQKALEEIFEDGFEDWQDPNEIEAGHEGHNHGSGGHNA